MGLDAHIILAHNKKELEQPNFFVNLPDFSDDIGDFEYDKPAIVCYWRKNWALHNLMSQKYEANNGNFVIVDRDTLEDMLHLVTHTKDYSYQGFAGVPQLCAVLYNYDTIRENGLRVFYEGDC